MKTETAHSNVHMDQLDLVLTGLEATRLPALKVDCQGIISLGVQCNTPYYHFYEKSSKYKTHFTGHEEGTSSGYGLNRRKLATKLLEVLEEQQQYEGNICYSNR